MKEVSTEEVWLRLKELFKVGSSVATPQMMSRRQLNITEVATSI